MPNNSGEPTLADRIRKVANRLEGFAEAVLAHGEPYPWDVWGADSDSLMIEAGRLLVEAIDGGSLEVDGIRRYPAYVNARIEGDAVPGWFADLFERVLWTLNLGPEDAPSAYAAHLKTWKADDPHREQLEARAFAELQRRRGEALATVAARLTESKPEPQADAKPAGAPGKGMTWQAAMKLAEEHCGRNPFPGVNALATIVRQTTGRTCSKATIRKAIDHSIKLRAKLAEHEARRKSVSAGPMSEAAAESAKQTRERDPAEAASTDEVFRALVEQSKEHERARLNGMSDAQRRDLVAALDENSIRELFKPRTR